MNVGFTGSRVVPPGTHPLIRDLVAELPPDTWVITGGCIGVDAIVARYAYRRRLNVHTVLPADRSRVDPQWMVWCTSHTEMGEGTTYRDRDEALVRRSDRLIALPLHTEEDRRSVRSGTWMTIRIALGVGKDVEIYLLQPHGALQGKYRAS